MKQQLRLEELTDLTHKAINILRAASIDGRVSWLSGHSAQNNDGSMTVAFRHKLGGKTATFTVNTKQEANACCEITFAIQSPKIKAPHVLEKNYN